MEELVSYLVFDLMVLCPFVAGAPLGHGSTLPTTADFHKNYLRRFGYMDENSEIEIAGEVLRTAVENFQAMANLPVTGVIDAATDKMMRTPRCGLSDVESQSPSRRKRYVLYNDRWDKTDLTYSLQSYPDQDLTQGETKSIIREAFQRWSDVSALRFTELDDADQGAVLTLNFFRRAHGDSTPFDGRGNVLAHTYIPPFGKVHFDNDEVWTNGTLELDGTNLRYVATHELGHAIGLQHSPEPDSVMRPYFHGQRNVDLGWDDVLGVQALYGPKPVDNDFPVTTTGDLSTTTAMEMTTSASQLVTTATEIEASKAQYQNETESETESKTETETESGIESETKTMATDTTTANLKRSSMRLLNTKEDWCSDGEIDIVLTIGQYPAYAFRGNVYAELTESGIDADGVRSIADDWPGLENDLDAAFHWASEDSQPIAYTYFFKGELCWKYTLFRELASGYPRLIRDEFPGIPDDLDAVLVLSPRNFNYFIKGSTFYRYSRAERRVYPGYPLSLFTWKDLPSQVDTAVKWTNARTYFFRSGKTYLVNSSRVEPGYPKSTAETWLGCPEERTR